MTENFPVMVFGKVTEWDVHYCIFQDTKMEIDVLKSEIDILQKSLRYHLFSTCSNYLLT